MCWHCWHTTLWVVSINVFRSLRTLEYKTEILCTERIVRGLRSVTLQVMRSVIVLAIPRPLSMGTDPVDDRNPESPRPRILAFLLPPVFAFPPPHILTVLPLHAPLPGVARALAPILRALRGRPWLHRWA